MNGEVIEFTRNNFLKNLDLATGVYLAKITMKKTSYLRKISVN